MGSMSTCSRTVLCSRSIRPWHESEHPGDGGGGGGGLVVEAVELVGDVVVGAGGEE